MIVPIVEGHAEVHSVPVIMRRLIADLPQMYVEIGTPVREKRQRVVQPGRLENAIELVITQRPGVKAIVLLIDADDDCPAVLAPDLLNRGNIAAGGRVGRHGDRPRCQNRGAGEIPPRAVQLGSASRT